MKAVKAEKGVRMMEMDMSEIMILKNGLRLLKEKEAHQLVVDQERGCPCDTYHMEKIDRYQQMLNEFSRLLRM